MSDQVMEAQAESAELLAAQAAVTAAEERRDTLASRVTISKDGITAARAHRDSLRQKVSLGEKVTPAAVGAAEKAIVDAEAHYALMLDAMPDAEAMVIQARSAVQDVQRAEKQVFIDELRQELKHAERAFLEAAKRRNHAAARVSAAVGGWPMPA